MMHPKDRQHALSWYAHRLSRVGPNIHFMVISPLEYLAQVV